MIIFCAGMPRSASTWSFNVAMRLLRAHAPDARIDSGFFENFAEWAAQKQERYDHLVAKCHAIDRSGASLLRLRAAKAIYTYRNPYDAVASAMNMFGLSFEESLDLIRESLRLYENELAPASTLSIAYEEILDRPLAVIGQIAEWLDLHPSSVQAAEIERETSIQTMREASAHVGENGSETVRVGGLVWDARTLLHPNHIRNGSSGYGFQEFSDAQKQVLLETFALSSIGQRYLRQHNNNPDLLLQGS